MPPRRSQTKEVSPEERPPFALSTITPTGTAIKLVLYYDKDEKSDILAVYHDDYRHVWIAQNDPIQYIHSRKQGQEHDDITCYYQPHHTWGGNRKDWPEFLFQYEAANKPRFQRDENPGRLYTREGWLVLDYKSHPVHDYKMPLTLSSQCEGYLMEAIMRENHHERIGVHDLLARMPGKMVNGKEPRRIGTISMRMNRFRREAGCITWEPKVGSDAIKNYLDKLLPAECILANSTRGFRNLHPHEKAEIETINAGLFPNKARKGKKNFSEKHQQQMFKQAEQKRLRKRAEFEEEHPSLAEDSKAGHYLTDLRTKAIAETTEGWAAVGSPTIDTFQGTSTPTLPSSSNVTDSTDSDATWEQQEFGTDYTQSSDSFSNESLGDIRHIEPKSDAFTYLVHLFLKPTIHHYQFLTHQLAPTFHEVLTYQEYYELLLDTFAAWIAANQTEIKFENVYLLGLIRFTVESFEWNFTYWDYEAFGQPPNVQYVEGYLRELQMMGELQGL